MLLIWLYTIVHYGLGKSNTPSRNSRVTVVRDFSPFEIGIEALLASQYRAYGSDFLLACDLWSGKCSALNRVKFWLNLTR